MSESIEPTEIITNRKKYQEKEKEKVLPPNPLMRLLARGFDYALFLLLLTALRSSLGKYFPAILFGHLIPFEFVAWIPIEACFLHFLGKTPGKFLFHISLKQGRKERLSFESAFLRSARVWFRGLGLGIPGLNALCAMVAYQQLKLIGSTSWDREDNISVSQRPVAQWKVALACSAMAISLLLYYRF